MSITYNGKSVLAIYRNGTAVEQALIAWNWTPRQLYFGGVQGAAYVPDASTVYGPGAEAVFGAGISTILDEKNGPPVIGPELVVNGTFINDASGWTIEAGSVAVIGGELAITSENNIGRVYQIVPVVVGKRYIVKATIRYGTSTGRFRVGTTLNGLQYGAYTDSFNTIFTAITNEMHLTPQNGGSVGTSYHSNISVREISENPATQTGASLRPLLGRSPLVKRNILIQTEDFSSTAWSKSLVTFQSAANNRWKIIPNLVSATALNIAQNPSQSFPDIAQTFTGYFESAAARYVSVRVGTQSNRYAAFTLDLVTGVVTAGGLAVTASATSVATGSGWFVTFQYILASGTTGNAIIICPSISPITIALNPLCSGNGVDGVIVGQPQMELSSVATPYQRVGAAVDITESGVTSYPFIRMDLSDDALTTSGLGSTKNLLRYTEEFDNAAWLKNGVTVPVTQYLAQDGTTTAELMYPSSTGTFRSVYQTINGGNTVSVYAKASGISHLWIIDKSGTAIAGWFNLSTGIKGTVIAGYTHDMVAVGTDGWYRCTLRANTGTFVYGQIGLSDVDNSVTATTGGTNGILIWGAQLELGSTATTYEYGGFKGTALVSGRSGSTFSDVTLPDGNFSLGPTTYTSGTANILRPVGDIVGYNLVNKTLTVKERKYLIEYYKDRGAKGLLVPGPELVTNGDFASNTAGWFFDGGATIASGVGVFTNDGTSQRLRQDILTIGKTYQITLTVSSYVTGTIAIQTGSNILNLPSANGTYTVLSFANTPLFGIRNGMTGVLNVDDVSVKELGPEEEWV